MTNQRWKVVRGTVKYKGTLYVMGDFLPENFSDRDRARHIYSRRMELCDYTEPSAIVVPKETSIPPKIEAKQAPTEDLPKEPPASPKKPTGTKKNKSN